MTDTLSAAPEVQAPELAEADAEQRLAENRFDVPALVAKADHRFLAGDHRAAAAFYAFAAKCSAQQSPKTPAASRALEMTGWLAGRFRHHIVVGLEAAGLPRGEWPHRFRKASKSCSAIDNAISSSSNFPRCRTSSSTPTCHTLI